MSLKAGERKLLTRRLLMAAAGALPLAAQQPPAISQPARPDNSRKALDDVRGTSDRLAKLEVPMDVAPAFVFRP